MINLKYEYMSVWQPVLLSAIAWVDSLELQLQGAASVGAEK